MSLYLFLSRILLLFGFEKNHKVASFFLLKHKEAAIDYFLSYLS